MPTNRYQLWPQIAILSALTTIGLSCFLVVTTWHWFTEWPPLSRHISIMLEAVRGIAIGDNGLLYRYLTYLRNNNLIDDFLLHVLLPVALSAPTATILSLKALYVEGGIDPDNHIQGPVMLAGRQASRHAKTMLGKEVNRRSAKRGIKLHPNVQLTETRELGNVFVFGQQGSGKSVIIKPLIKQIIDRGDRILLYDQKGEYTSLFFQTGVGLINPTDQRTLAWNPCKDVTNEEQAALLAGCLINEAGHDEFWVSGARLILSGCIISCIKTRKAWSWAEVKAAIDQPELELRKSLDQVYPAAATLVQKDSKTTQGFLTILATQLSWLDVLVKAWPQSVENSFAISDWIKGDRSEQVLIIPSDPLYSSVSGPLVNALLSLATQHLLALPDSSKRRIWFGLDELGNLPKCHALSRLLTLGRSKGARAIAGTQSISQLHTIYGHDQSETLLSLFGNVISLRLGVAGASAKKASESFGRRIVKRPNATYDHLGHRSVSYQQLEVPVVYPEQITHLPQVGRRGVKGFLSITGWNSVYLLFWPLPDITKAGPEKIPAAWLSHAGEEATPDRKRRRGTKGRVRTC